MPRPGYRPPTQPPKGAWARHLDRQAAARNLNQTAIFELVQQRLGLSPKSRTAFLRILTGEKQPDDDQATILAAEFGWPEDADDQPTPTSDAALLRLAEAIEAQNGLIVEVLAALRRSADGQVALAQNMAAVATMALEARGLAARPSETPGQ